MSQLTGSEDDFDIGQGFTPSQQVIPPFYGSGNFGGSVKPGNIIPTPNLPISQVSIPTLSTEPTSSVDITPTRLIPPIATSTSVLDNDPTQQSSATYTLQGPTATGLLASASTGTVSSSSVSTTTTGTTSSGLIIAVIIVIALFAL